MQMGLHQIKGVGPATVQKLNKAGVKTLDDMRNMDTLAIAEKTGIAEMRLREWRTEAKLTKVLDDIKGIGPSTRKKLQDAGIHNLDDFVKASIHEVAHATRIAQDRLKEWQSEADKLVKQAEAFARKEGTVVAERSRELAATAKKASQDAMVKGKAAAGAARRKGEDLAHDVAARVEGMRQHKNDEPAAETVDATANGGSGFIGRLKQIFAPKRSS